MISPDAIPPSMGAYRYKADMIDIEPSCVRTILVPDGFDFRQLSYALCIAFEWWEGHEHMFGVVIDAKKGEVLDITDYGDDFGMDEYRDEDTPSRSSKGRRSSTPTTWGTNGGIW